MDSFQKVNQCIITGNIFDGTAIFNEGFLDRVREFSMNFRKDQNLSFGSLELSMPIRKCPKFDLWSILHRY